MCIKKKGVNGFRYAVLFRIKAHHLKDGDINIYDKTYTGSI